MRALTSTMSDPLGITHMVLLIAKTWRKLTLAMQLEMPITTASTLIVAHKRLSCLDSGPGIDSGRFPTYGSYEVKLT